MSLLRLGLTLRGSPPEGLCIIFTALDRRQRLVPVVELIPIVFYTNHVSIAGLEFVHSFIDFHISYSALPLRFLVCVCREAYYGFYNLDLL